MPDRDDWKGRRDPMREAYVEATGHEPPPADTEHPLAAQWEYRGTLDERRELARMLGERDDPPELIDGQGSLL